MQQGSLQSTSNKIVLAAVQGEKKLENKQRNVQTAFTFGQRLNYADLDIDNQDYVASIK